MKKTTKTIEYSEGCVGFNSYTSIINESHSFLSEGMVFSVNGGREMNGLKPVGLIEEVHGHKGTVMVKPLNSVSNEIMDLKKVILIDLQNNQTTREVHEVRKYRRGKFLVKFRGLKWRTEIEGYRNLIMAV